MTGVTHAGEAGTWGGVEDEERVVMNMKVGATQKVNTGNGGASGA